MFYNFNCMNKFLVFHVIKSDRSERVLDDICSDKFGVDSCPGLMGQASMMMC